MARKRVRELGLVIGSGTPGPRNAISDVPGVKVGHTTLIEGEGKLVPGAGPIRTGVTAILPHGGNLYDEPVGAAAHVINGFGKATGLAQVAELGVLEAPILITSTLNVGLVWDAAVQYLIDQNPEAAISSPTPNPVVLECHDGFLNDAQGRHVRQQHVLSSIEKCSTKVVEGCVGAGTGMTAYGYKSGIGTASRRLAKKHGAHTVGCLVVLNCGRRGDLIMGGIPVGKLLKDPQTDRMCPRGEDGSIIVILGTDAPLSSRQLGRLARRAVVGIGRTGSVVSHGSGDFVVAFSTVPRISRQKRIFTTRDQLPDKLLTPLFAAVAEATEEAILNALCMAESMEGRDGNLAEAIPIDRLRHLIERFK
ncbi:MAG: P1 family peptidase [Promethearchaeota archaeon]